MKQWGVKHCDKTCREVEPVENFYFSWCREHASFWESQFSETAERGLHQDHTQTPSARSSLLPIGLSGSSWDTDSWHSTSRRVLRYLTVCTDTWVEPGPTYLSFHTPYQMVLPQKVSSKQNQCVVIEFRHYRCLHFILHSYSPHFSSVVACWLFFIINLSERQPMTGDSVVIHMLLMGQRKLLYKDGGDMTKESYS